MELLHGHHEGSYRATVILAPAEFFGPVVHRIEFSNFVGVTDAFEKTFNGFPRAWLLEVILRDAELCEGRWEEQINCLGLVAVV